MERDFDVELGIENFFEEFRGDQGIKGREY